MSPTDTAQSGTAERWANWTAPETVDVDGLTTAYRRSGSGEPLLFLHGGGGTRGWFPIHRELAARFDVIAPEHPGFGDTPRPEVFDSWQDMVLHYDGFLRALNLEHVHLVGTSLGAWLAANLAITYPERFRSITLITPLGARIEDEPFIDIFRMGAEAEAAAMFNGREDRIAGQFVQEGGLDDLIREFEEKATAAMLMFNPRYDYKLDHRLRRVTVPVHVIAAEEDRITGPMQAPRFAELIPGATLTTIAGPTGEPSSHGVIYEQPEASAAAIADFIDRI